VSSYVRLAGQTNDVEVLFSKPVPSSTAGNVQNYEIKVSGTTNTVPVSTALINGPLVRLRVGGPNWVIGGDYYLTVNNLVDTSGPTARLAFHGQC